MLSIWGCQTNCNVIWPVKKEIQTRDRNSKSTISQYQHTKKIELRVIGLKEVHILLIIHSMQNNSSEVYVQYMHFYHIWEEGTMGSLVHSNILTHLKNGMLWFTSFLTDQIVKDCNLVLTCIYWTYLIVYWVQNLRLIRACRSLAIIDPA